MGEVSWKLSELLEEIDFKIENSTDLSRIIIQQLANNSQFVEPGSLFFAIPGIKSDGGKYIPMAIQRGSVAVIADSNSFIPTENFSKDIPLILVEDIRKIFSRISARYYGEVTRDMLSIGVTGTNGKTSISWLISEALANLGHTVGHLGTLGMRMVDNDREIETIDTGVTTPDSVVIHQYLAGIKSSKVRSFVAEVSSHGLDQSRTADIHWDIGIFTNLTRDHLDYHPTMEDYAKAKKRFFEEELVSSCKPNRFAVFNLDDPYGKLWAEEVCRECSRISSVTISENDSSADVYVESSHGDVHFTKIDGIVLGQRISLQTQLVGQYNVFNVIAAAAALSLAGFSWDQIISAIGQVRPVPGRLDRIINQIKTVFVDYAHTPDALIRAQQSLKALTKGRLITVFGCGGDRDRGKRSLMGRAVSELSDIAVVTSDNPRTEEPMTIIEDILPGFSKRPGFNFLVESDRKRALQLAIDLARPEDVILVAGKGHETYQEIYGVKYPFSDQQVCREIFREMEER